MNGQFFKAPATVTLCWAGLASLLLHAMVILLPLLIVFPGGQTATGRWPGAALSGVAWRTLQARLLPAGEAGADRHSEVVTETVTETVTEKPPLETMPVSPPVLQTQGAHAVPDESVRPAFDTPQFYPVDQLDQKPRLLETSELDTEEVQAIVASGILVLKLWIDARGRVVNVEIERSDLPELFARSAASAFERMRFAPGQRAGQLVGSVLRIEVRYDDGRQSASPGGTGASSVTQMVQP